MKAMILAAGRGERMRPLTDSTPKPLLEVNGQPILSYHLHSLARAGIHDIVINHAWLGEQIVERFGDGHDFGVHIQYSAESEALETAGGIHHALPLLGTEAFIVVNGDILTDFNFAELSDCNTEYAHLIMVPNPVHHPEGDFALEQGKLSESGSDKYTFSGIGVYHPDLFRSIPEKKYPLAPILRAAMRTGNISGQLYEGTWVDIGTPERLQQLNQTGLN